MSTDSAEEPENKQAKTEDGSDAGMLASHLNQLLSLHFSLLEP